MGTKPTGWSLNLFRYFPALSLLFLSGCFINRDLTLAPQFQGIAGSSFVLKEDVLAYYFTREPKRTKLAPFGPGNSDLPSRSEMKPTPFRYENLIVEEIVPKGTVFSVTNVTNDVSFEISMLVYKVKIEKSQNPILLGKSFEIRDLLSVKGDESTGPVFNQEFVETYNPLAH